ncbi:hypothetical protein [Achromobacter xylosoxidans]|uniref:hypothetical protein n=2 Tax=Alcaligenes xylosoxydans xylosoxydans TaxID=85698 RepID=UPI000A57E984|nr:hypothetical protein [Achromobacter xylosoxidans]
MATRIYKTPFAATGDKEVLATADQPDGKVSLQAGWTPDYELPNDNANYRPVGRAEMNGILSEVTEGLGDVQLNGFAKWQAIDGGWPLYAMVVHAGVVYSSTEVANTTEPGTAGAKWDRAFLHSPALSGTPTAPTPAAGDISTKIATTEFVQSSASGGQCRLSVASPTSLTLLPFNGNQIIVGGYARQIPLGGVSISNSGLPANALRYVYAYSSSGAIALELSSTGHSVGPNGVEVKNGDASRSLVGMIYTTASSQFADSHTQRLCANWFNRRSRAAVATLLVDTNFSTVVSSEITANLRASALYWSNSGAYSLIANGSVSNNTAGGIVGFEGRINGGVFGTEARSTIATAAQYECLVSASHSENIAEGLVTASAYGYVSSGSTATLYGTATVNLTVQA